MFYVDWTKMCKDDRLKGDKPYDSEETADLKIQGDKLFWQGRICVPDCLIDKYVKHWHQNETAHGRSRVLEQELRHRVYTRDLKGACERVGRMQAMSIEHPQESKGRRTNERITDS